MCGILKFVVCSAAEAELAALFLEPCGLASHMAQSHAHLMSVRISLGSSQRPKSKTSEGRKVFHWFALSGGEYTTSTALKTIMMFEQGLDKFVDYLVHELLCAKTHPS